MEFDMQRFLTDMKTEISADIASLKREMKDGNDRLESKVDTCLLTLADHETRVTVIEQTPPADHETRIVKVEGFIKNARWLVGTVIVGGITALFGYVTTLFTNHQGSH